MFGTRGVSKSHLSAERLGKTTPFLEEPVCSRDLSFEYSYQNLLARIYQSRKRSVSSYIKRLCATGMSASSNCYNQLGQSRCLLLGGNQGPLRTGAFKSARSLVADAGFLFSLDIGLG